MQDRYTGDIGDYGKLGLLRRLQSAGLSIGVNWLLTPNDKDGDLTQYLDDDSFCDCDEELWKELKEIVATKKRTVSSLEKESILEAIFFSKCLDFSNLSKQERASFRNVWNNEALNTLKGLDIVFIDPDNGLIVPSAVGTRKENKFVKLEELEKYYKQDSSVIYYQHKARRQDSFYINQHKELLDRLGLDYCLGYGLKFIRISLRYYFFIMQPGHKELITKTMREMLAGPWGKHFQYYDPEYGDSFNRI